jgi:hypothetical protein
MGMKEQQRQTYRSMQGKEIDMHKLILQNETTVAVGNVRVNARGDLLGPGGKIIKTSEDVVQEAGVPDQINVRKQANNAPVKNVQDMDPEGNE